MRQSASCARLETPAFRSVISFTVETDGRLPDGQSLGEAIEAVDEATDESAAYFMLNCAHPTHFESVLEGAWIGRLRGLRANASSKSHAELDEATELDSGDPLELAAQYATLRSRTPQPHRRGRLLRHRPTAHPGDLRRSGCVLVRRVRELAELAGDEEGGLLADVDGVVADALEAARDDDHAHPPLAALGVAAERDHLLDRAPVGAVDELVELDAATRARSMSRSANESSATRIISSARAPISSNASTSVGSGREPRASFVSLAMVTH